MTEVYNSSLTTRLIDPVFEKAKFRSEYRLQPNTLYLPNLRLLNSGITSNIAGKVNGLVGMYGCIKSIQLYDGNQLLDQMLEASILNGFKNFNNPNDQNISVNRYLKGVTLGYTAEGEHDIDAGSGTLNRDGILVQTDVPFTPTTGEKSWVALNQLLPFLKSSVTLPTNVYSHLRLVINWKNASELQDMIGDGTGGRAGTLSTIENTILVADEMNDSDTKAQLMGNYEGVAYRPIEHDSVDIPAVTPPTDGTADQENNVMVKGFNGKRLNTLLMVNTPTDQSTWVDSSSNTNETSYANQGSVSQYKPQVQVRVNGSNKLARNGLTGYNKRLATLVDAYGEVNVVMNQNVPDLADGTNYIDEEDAPTGQLDYTGLRIDEDVQEIIVDFNRTGVDRNPELNQRLRLNLFGEVNKQVVMRNDGRYNVIYS
tara:strand:- start:5601 stop:6881 length:1281 start_codon:yes stop_codon:yes gene_type:complete